MGALAVPGWEGLGAGETTRRRMLPNFYQRLPIWSVQARRRRPPQAASPCREKGILAEYRDRIRLLGPGTGTDKLL